MNLIIEEISIWDKLKNTDKDIYLYGLGLGSEKIIEICQKRGIKISCLLISDGQRKVKTDITGYDIIKISEGLKNPNAIILLGFGTQKREVLDYFYYLDDNYEVYSPDVPVFGDGVFDMEFYRDNEENFKKAYALLADDISRETFKATIDYKISGKLKYLRSYTQHKDEMFKEILEINQNEHFVDLGAYNGDTIRELLEYGNYNNITAFEPDKRNYAKLCNFIKDKVGIDALNIGVWEKEDTLYFDYKSSRNSSLLQDGKIEVLVNSVDNVMKDKKVTLIKMDVEGAEKQAIKGAINTIKEQKPRLNIGVYHRNEDLFDILLYLHEICPQYKFYIRHHEYVPSWDTNLYATI